MAILIPPQLRNDAPKSEKRVFEALKFLNDEWHVFSHVFWQSQRQGREGDGEIDFLLFHSNVGLVVLEVKGGAIDLAEGQWFSSGNGGRFEIKNPFEQATINKYALIRILQENDLGNVPVIHAVCFPDCSESQGVSTYGARDIIWWAQDLKNVDVALCRTIRHWQSARRVDPSAAKRIRSLFAPTANFRRRLIDDVGNVAEQLLRLTDEQYRVFEGIQRNRRAVVRGGPGTGKTLLSIERARRLSRQGFKTLWTCYNELLATHVQTELAEYPSITARTFHSLCMKEIRTANIDLPKLLDEPFWEIQAPHMLLDAAATNGTLFDAIVVDEGQDFSQDWIDALETLSSATKDAPLYVFADSNQRLYPRRWSINNAVELDLTINCRNSRQIACKVARIFDDADPDYGADGPEPVFSEVNGVRTALQRIEARATALIEQERLSPSQITILLDDETAANRLRERYAGQYPFVRYGQVGVVVESVRRFKGLESDVIIVALPEPESLNEDALRRLCYVAFSRARALLIVVSTSSIKRLLSW